jgi:hypothetical protein
MIAPLLLCLALDAAAPDAGVEAGTSDAGAEVAPADAPPPAPPLPTGTLERLVLERGTRRPVPGATLTLDLGAAGETDEKGRVSLSAPCGPHRLAIQQPGFETITLEVDPCLQPTAPPVRLQRSKVLSYETVISAPTPHQQVRLEADELTKTPGTMGDPLRALESLPGVTTVTWPAAVYAVRGANPGNTGFFLDDVRIPALFHLALGPSVLHPYFFGGMDFYPGGYPARYGRYVGGIVAAQTRAPETDQVHGSVDVRLVDAGAMVSAPFPDGRGAVALAGRYSYTGAMVSLFSDRVSLGYWDYQLRIDRRAGPLRLSLLAFSSDDHLSATGNRQQDVAIRFHRLSLRAQMPAGQGSVQARVGVGLDRSQAPLADTFPIVMKSSSLTPRASYRRNGAAADVELGVEGELTRYQPISQVQRPGLIDISHPRTVALVAPYASSTVRLGSAVSLTPELRLDSYTIGDTTATSWGPRLAARLAMGETTWLHVAGGRFTQLPSIPLQVPGAESFGLALYGLQRSWQSSMGVGTRALAPVEGDLTVYVQRYRLTDVRDPRVQHVDPLYDDFLVAREALSYGVELMLRRPVSERLHGWLSYSLSRSLRAVGGGVVAPSDWDQRHVFNLVAGYRWNRTTFGGRVHFNTGRPYLIADYSQAYVERLPAFFQLDLRIDRRIVFDAWALELYAELANATLTRQVYSLGTNYNGPDSTKDSFRLVIPSLGLHGEF